MKNISFKALCVFEQEPNTLSVNLAHQVDKEKLKTMKEWHGKVMATPEGNLMIKQRASGWHRSESETLISTRNGGLRVLKNGSTRMTITLPMSMDLDVQQKELAMQTLEMCEFMGRRRSLIEGIQHYQRMEK